MTQPEVQTQIQLWEEDRFPFLSEMLQDFLSPQLAVDIDPADPQQAMAIFVDQLTLDMPVEIQSQQDQAGKYFGVLPPTQWIETTVEPIQHRLRLTMALSEESLSESQDN